MSKYYTATEARADFFNILNSVIYNNEVVFIEKSGTKDFVKIEKAKENKKDLFSLAGKLSDKDADIMLKSIEDRKKIKEDPTPDFDKK